MLQELFCYAVAAQLYQTQLRPLGAWSIAWVSGNIGNIIDEVGELLDYFEVSSVASVSNRKQPAWGFRSWLSVESICRNSMAPVSYPDSPADYRPYALEPFPVFAKYFHFFNIHIARLKRCQLSLFI